VNRGPASFTLATERGMMDKTENCSSCEESAPRTTARHREMDALPSPLLMRGEVQQLVSFEVRVIPRDVFEVKQRDTSSSETTNALKMSDYCIVRWWTGIPQKGG